MGWFENWWNQTKKDHTIPLVPVAPSYNAEVVPEKSDISEPVYSLVRELEDESKWHVACDPHWAVLTYSHWYHDLTVSFSPSNYYASKTNFHCCSNWMTDAEKKYVSAEHDRILRMRDDIRKKKDRDAFRVLVKPD